MESTNPTATLPEEIGRYRILGRLYDGSIAQVLEAQQGAQPVLLMSVRLPGAEHERAARRDKFLENTQRLKEVLHPGTLQVLDIWAQDTNVFLVVERSVGTNLSALVSLGRIPFETTVSIGVQLADALQHIHESGFVARDIQPDTTMLDDEGRVVSGALVAAIVAEAASEQMGASVIGRPGYIAPELIEGRPPSPLSDQYALGATLLTIASGRTHAALAEDLVASAVRAGLELDWASFPNDEPHNVLRPVLERMTARRPENRFEDMMGAIRALSHLVDDWDSVDMSAFALDGEDTRPEALVPVTMTVRAWSSPGEVDDDLEVELEMDSTSIPFFSPVASRPGSAADTQQLIRDMRERAERFWSNSNSEYGPNETIEEGDSTDEWSETTEHDEDDLEVTAAGDAEIITPWEDESDRRTELGDDETAAPTIVPGPSVPAPAIDLGRVAPRQDVDQTIRKRETVAERPPRDAPTEADIPPDDFIEAGPDTIAEVDDLADLIAEDLLVSAPDLDDTAAEQTEDVAPTKINPELKEAKIESEDLIEFSGVAVTPPLMDDGTDDVARPAPTPVIEPPQPRAPTPALHSLSAPPMPAYTSQPPTPMPVEPPPRSPWVTAALAIGGFAIGIGSLFGADVWLEYERRALDTSPPVALMRVPQSNDKAGIEYAFTGSAPDAADVQIAKKLLRDAETKLAARDLDAAEKNFGLCIRAANLPECHKRLGILYAVVQDPASRHHLERFLELAPDDPDAEAIRAKLR